MSESNNSQTKAGCGCFNQGNRSLKRIIKFHKYKKKVVSVERMVKCTCCVWERVCVCEPVSCDGELTGAASLSVSASLSFHPALMILGLLHCPIKQASVCLICFALINSSSSSFSSDALSRNLLPPWRDDKYSILVFLIGSWTDAAGTREITEWAHYSCFKSHSAKSFCCPCLLNEKRVKSSTWKKQ